MKLRKSITMIFGVSMITIVLAVSTGFTVFIHTCNNCNESSLNTRLYNNDGPLYDNCCCNSYSQDAEGISSIHGKSCCNTNADHLNIIEGFPGAQLNNLPAIYIIPVIKQDISFLLHSQSSITPHKVFYIYGGRDIITSCHQLLI